MDRLHLRRVRVGRDHHCVRVDRATRRADLDAVLENGLDVGLDDGGAWEHDGEHRLGSAGKPAHEPPAGCR